MSKAGKRNLKSVRKARSFARPGVLDLGVNRVSYHNVMVSAATRLPYAPIHA